MLQAAHDEEQIPRQNDTGVRLGSLFHGERSTEKGKKKSVKGYVLEVEGFHRRFNRDTPIILYSRVWSHMSPPKAQPPTFTSVWLFLPPC